VPTRDDDDDSAFREAMRGARPLPAGRGRVPAAERAPAAAAPTRGAAKPAPTTFIVERAGDSSGGRAPDVAAREVRSLRAGERDVDGRIDLHGRVRAAAVRDLETFLAAGRARGARVVLVIHGRGHGSDPGGPVLRPAVWDWLGGARAERCGVMAFVSAPPRQGGDGATLVLLRRR
jgi:DNA-nicking Smr family endonuclease